MNLANAILWQVLVSDLYMSIAVASGQMLVLPTDFFSRIYIFIHSELASLFLFTTGLWAIKVSFLLFFRGLGNKIRRQRIIWWCALGFTAASYPVCLGLYDYRCLVRPDGASLGTPHCPFFPPISANMYAANCSSIRSANYIYVTTRCNTALDIITDAFSKIWQIFLVPLLMAYSRSSFNQHSMEGPNQPTQEIGICWHFLSHSVHRMHIHHQDLDSLKRSSSGSYLDYVLGSDREFSRYDTLDH